MKTIFYYEGLYSLGPISSYSKEEVKGVWGVVEGIMDELEEGIK